MAGSGAQLSNGNKQRKEGGEKGETSDHGREVSSQCVLVSKNGGEGELLSCKQTQDARREVDSRAAAAKGEFQLLLRCWVLGCWVLAGGARGHRCGGCVVWDIHCNYCVVC